MKRAIIALGLLVFLVSGASADVSVAILKGEAVGERMATLSVSAIDEAGRPIKGLTAANFELIVGGAKVDDFTVKPSSTAEEPLSIILSVDVSGSMWGAPFRETQKAISIFLDQLDKKDFVSLLSFGTEVTSLTDFTTERYTVRNQVEALRPVADWTHLYDATYEAIHKGRDAPTTRAAVILLTDGRDEGSLRSRQEAVDIAMGASIPVFTIGFGENIDNAYLQEIAQLSGGDFVFTPEPGKITELYEKVLDQLKNQYQIQFEFAKEPSTYKARLTLSYANERIRASREFLFNPAGTPIVVAPPQIATEKIGEPLKPWHVSLTSRQLMTIGIIFFAVTIGLIVLLSIVYFKVRRRRIEKEEREREEREKRDKRIIEMIESSGSDECELEYPSGHHTAVQPLDSRTGQMTRVSHDSPDALLQIDSMKRSVPLIHQGVEVLNELIIAKKSHDRVSFRKKSAVYLWTKNEFISRANKERAGHARIFIGESERFMIEDLGSMNGTWIGGKKIDGVFPLQDGDVLDVGGKEGLRILYKEGSQEVRDLERTMIFK